jgi:hypothetical protein
VTGRAFLFAPDNFPNGTYVGVQIPDRPAYALTDSLSIAGWIRPRGDGYAIFSAATIGRVWILIALPCRAITVFVFKSMEGTMTTPLSLKPRSLTLNGFMWRQPSMAARGK